MTKTAQGQRRERTSLDILLDSVFDYAGLFPPASLPFPAMLETASQFRESLIRPGIVGSELVVPEKDLLKLDDLTLMYAGFRSGDSVRVSVLGALGRTVERSSLKLYRKTHVESSLSRSFTSYEVKIPSESAPTSQEILDHLAHLTAYVGDPSVSLSLELDGSVSNIEALIHVLVESLSLFGARCTQTTAIKLRCAGPTAVSRSALATAINLCGEERINLKLTMGLHHPMTGLLPQESHLGFLNVLISYALKRHLGASFNRSEICDCLENQDATKINFSDGVAWQDFHITREDLSSLTSSRPVSIGSCSLHEPDAYLAELFPLTIASRAL